MRGLDKIGAVLTIIVISAFLCFIFNAHVSSKNQQNFLSQKNAKMAIHMAAMTPQMTKEDAEGVSSMVAFPSPARKIKLAPDAEGGGVGEQLH